MTRSIIRRQIDAVHDLLDNPPFTMVRHGDLYRIVPKPFIAVDSATLPVPSEMGIEHTEDPKTAAFICRAKIAEAIVTAIRGIK